MRKEVFYSLMAMTAVPGAANATPVSGTGTAGAIIPDVISFDNNAADLDGDPENGLIKWCSGAITFNINKKLVPGTYTFRARLLTSAAAVLVKIPKAIDPTTNKAVEAKQNMVTDLDPDKSDRDIEVKFVIKEETSDLAITIEPTVNYEVAANKYYLIGKCKDTNLQSGLIFDESNFTTALESLNKLIDDYVNKVFGSIGPNAIKGYEYAVARQLMNSAKETVQGMITNVSNLTYDDFVNNGLGEEDLKQSPIFKKATKLFNQSTRLEADYQTKKLKKQIEKALEDSREDILDADNKPTGEKTDANPYLKEMADEVLEDIKKYDESADKMTGAKIDAQGNVQGGNEDAAAELDPQGFDVDPNFPPLKNLVQETNRVSEPGGFAHVIADALQLSDKAIKEREDDLTEKYNEMGDLLGNRTNSDNILNGAKTITNYYREVFKQIKDEVDDKSIPEMTSDFKDDIKSRLENAINNNVKETSDYIKEYYTLYNNYKNLLATLKLDEKPQLTPTAEKRYGKTQEYLDKSQEFDQQQKLAQTEVALPQPKVKEEQAVKNEKGENATTTLTILESTNVTSNAQWTGVYALDFKAYVNGLNELDKAYIAWETAEQKAKDAYDEEKGGYANNLKYDNTKFFKEEFLNYFYKVNNPGTNSESWTPMTFVSSPGVAATGQTQDKGYTHEEFLLKLKDQLEDMWGTFDNVTYKRHIDQSLADYATPTDKLLLLTISTFINQLNDDPASPNKNYAKRAIANAKAAKELGEKLAEVTGAIQKLRERVASSPIYSAKPEIYAVDPTNLAGPQPYDVPVEGSTSTKNISYTIPAKEGQPYTWKQILFDFEKDVKSWADSWDKVIDDKDAENFDNQLHNNHSKRLVRLLNKLKEQYDTTDPTKLADQILSQIEEFVKEGGVIDQQEQAYATHAAKDNYASWKEFLDPSSGALNKLNDRIQKDWKGANGNGGYYVKDDPDQDDYYVGYDQPDATTGEPDGKIDTNTELVTFQSWTKNIPGYNGESLNSDKYQVFTAIINSFEKKRKEALAIYDKWVTNADTAIPTAWDADGNPTAYKAQADWEEPLDYEKANVELAKAAEMIDEVNTKLEKEFEQPLVKEIKAQREHENIRKNIFNDETQTDGNNNSNMAYVKYGSFKLGKWDNGRKGVSKVVMGDCKNLLGFFKPLTDQLLNDGPADQEAYDEAKAALNPKDLLIYQRIEDVYKRVIQLRKDMNAAYLQGNPQEQWENGKQLEYKQIEDEIKLIVTACGEQEDDIVANQEALKALQELTNLDADNGNGSYDWDDLFDVDPDGNFILKDLTLTSGYQNIKTNDDKAKKPEDLLEPYEEGKDGGIKKLQTFYNQLADGDNQMGSVAVTFATARALREAAEDEKIGGELYEAVKQFLADLNEAIKKRTLDDELVEFKKRFRELCDNVLLIDQHALENKLNYASMLDDVDKLQKQYDAAKAIVDNMPESDAWEKALYDLKNAYDENVDPLKDVAKKQYEEGHAWKDDVQDEWNKLFVKNQTALTKALDLLTGENNSTIVDENSNAYNTFDKDYKAATTEYYILVDKLEQLKNLDADVAQYGDNFYVDATALATEINDYLFGTATEKPKDALDRIYNEGTDNMKECNAESPAKAWARQWSTDLNKIKSMIEEYIGKVDGQIDKAMADWDDSYSSTIKGTAQEALEAYSIYWETYKPIDAMPESNAKTAALNKAVLGIINGNAVFNPLYKKTTDVDNRVKEIKASKVGEKGYTKLLDVNKLYDDIKYLTDNFDNAEKSLLTEGKDIEAVKEVNSYKDYAKEHLTGDKGDKQTLIDLGLPLDEKIPGGKNLDELSDKTFNEVYEDYVNIFFEEDAETGELVEKKVTADNWKNTFVDLIEPVVGWKVYDEKTGKCEWKDKKGTQVSECQFIHQLKTNADEQNQKANMALVAKLKSAVDDARDYIAGYQVAPQFDIDLIDLAMDVEKAEQLIQDPERIASTNNITAQVKKLQDKLGTISTKDTGKYDEQNADKLGTMEAETSSKVDGQPGLPETVKAAFDAEKKHLEADVNALRAEYKKYTEAGNADNGYNERIEALWLRVEAAKCEPNIDETKVNGVTKKDFKDWTRTDLVDDIQKDIKALWKELRAANNDAIDMAATAQALNDRLASLADNKVQDEYAAGAPDVTSYQQAIDELILKAQAAVDASAQAGDVDYEREKLEAMAQNVENMIAARDACAKEWTDFKEFADEQLDDFLDALNRSKTAVNQWVDDEYDLAANANSAELYAQADAKGAEYAQLWSDIVAKYPETKAVLSKDLDDLGDEFLELIEQAEDAAADFDLGNRLTNLNNQLTVLKNKAKNGNYPEGYLYANDIYDPETEEFLFGITSIETAIVDFGQLLETTETTVYTTEDDAKYASLRAMLDEWILDNPDTEEDETELIGGIQKDINDVAEILGSNVLGDMNNDGKVTLVDAKMIADIVLGKSSQPMPGTDDFTHADVNEDNLITIADASCAVNIYFYGNPEGINYWVPEEARVAGKTAEKLELTTSKTADGLTRVAVNLDNVQAYTAFQMDMQLPEGVKLVVAHMGERANTQYLMVNELEDATRIAALSLTNKAFKGNSGAVLYLDFEVAEGAEENFVRFQNVLFVNRNAQQTAFELGGITPTGIQSANAETALGQKIYDLGGRMKSSLKKGVNIIKDAAGNARKVFSK